MSFQRLSYSFDCSGHFQYDALNHKWKRLWLYLFFLYTYRKNIFIFSVRSCGRDLPVELINILYVSKQGTHLLWPYGKVTHINNVSQVVLENSRDKVMYER